MARAAQRFFYTRARNPAHCESLVPRFAGFHRLSERFVLLIHARPLLNTRIRHILSMSCCKTQMIPLQQQRGLSCTKERLIEVFAEHLKRRTAYRIPMCSTTWSAASRKPSAGGYAITLTTRRRGGVVLPRGRTAGTVRIGRSLARLADSCFNRPGAAAAARRSPRQTRSRSCARARR